MCSVLEWNPCCNNTNKWKHTAHFEEKILNTLYMFRQDSMPPFKRTIIHHNQGKS